MALELDERSCFSELAQGGRRAERAAGLLYDGYARRFMAFMRMRAVNHSAAEEIVQDVFMRLFEARDELAKVESPRAYLWRMLRNAMTDHFRASGREHAVRADIPTSAADPEFGFDQWLEQFVGSDGLEAEREDLVRCIARALEALRTQSPEKALVIDLAAIEGLSGHELAETLGRNYGAARQFLSEARKALEMISRQTCGALLP